MRSFEDIPYGRGGKLDLWLPDTEAFDVFLYFHGGGLEKGAKSNARRYVPFLPDRGVCVVSADYRMYPEARYPDFIEDAAEAVAWVKGHIGEYGSCRRLFVGGSSAGAYLSMMLCFDGRYLAKHSLSPDDIDGFIHNAGQPTAHFRVLRERGLDKRRLIVDETAPLYYVGTAETYPPMLFLVADGDMKNRYEQTMLMVSTLRHFGHEEPRVRLRVIEGTTHCSYNKPTREGEPAPFARLVYDYIQSI